MKNEETGFLHSTNFKLLLQIEAISIKYCDFSKFIIPVQTIVFISRPGCPKPNYAPDYVSLSILYTCNDSVTYGATQFWMLTIVDVSKYKH